ncbi:MAG: hypothetical protein GEU71_10425 [Actinobacteria bacterium]|nr:hypothetical protein [Actinomycetota bacterium]
MGSEARTRLALIGLLAVTLFSFSQLFADGDYPGPAALGMLIAAGIAILARRFGVSILLTTIASFVAMTTYLAFIFQTKNTFYGLPTPGAVRGLVDAVRGALDQAEIDFAPVPVRPGYVIMVVAGLWIAAALGEVATFRWRKPLIASVTPVVLFSVVMVVGTGAGTPLFVALFLIALLAYWGVESSHRLRSWGRWVPTWADHDAEEEPDSITGEIARKMGATCVALALIAPIFLPALGDGLLSWRNPSGQGGGPGVGGSGDGEGGGRIDPLVSIAPTLISQTETDLFRVQAETNTYWRLITLPDFDGATWRPSSADLVPIEDGAIDGPTPVSTASRTLEQRITITGLVSDSLPAAVQATNIQLITQQNLDGLRYDPESGDIRSTTELGGSLVYDVTSDVPEESYTELVNAHIGDPGIPGDDIYTQLPDELSPEVKDLLAGWVSTGGTEFEQLVAVQDHLRNPEEFTYSIIPEEIRAEQEASTDDLTNFLINSKTGYCQQFSTAFAVLARELGYPSRLVVGFLPGEAIGEGENVVKGTDAHAWPEVYFNHIGWIAFEPTPRVDATRSTNVPHYTTPQNPGTEGPIGVDGANSGPNPGDVDPRLEDAGINPGGDLSPEELQNLINSGAIPGGAELPETQPWERTFRIVSIVLLAGALMFILSIPALKEWRIKRAYAGAKGTRDLASAAFLDFCLNARELATNRGIAESPTSYVTRVAELKGIPERAAIRLAAIYEAAEYSSRDVSALDAGEARKLARGLRKNMWSRSTVWQRAVRLFSPRNLSQGLPELRLPWISGRRAAA